VHDERSWHVRPGTNTANNVNGFLPATVGDFIFLTQPFAELEIRSKYRVKPKSEVISLSRNFGLSSKFPLSEKAQRKSKSKGEVTQLTVYYVYT